MSGRQAQAPARELPGDVAMWIFILAELCTFAAFFLLFAWLEHQDGATFAMGRSQLHPRLGVVNTLILLSGGVMALAGVRAMDRTPCAPRRAILWFRLAAATGVPFTAIKIWEFGALMSQGLNLSSSTFHFFYFFLCFIHMAHVWLGMAILLLACRRLGVDTGEERISSLQAAAAYWHMVDLVWLVLFPLLYTGARP